MTSRRAALRIGTSSTPKSPAFPRPRVLVIFGTRPEAIKLCPLISALRAEPVRAQLEVRVCITGQHREMVQQVISALGVEPDFDLALMQPGQSLPELSSRLLAALPAVFAECAPALTVVQGDTTTAFCAAVTAFYLHVPVAHVEAGLRTHDLASPFPEEMNRVFADRLAALHFAATSGAAENLLHEGIASEGIEVTGNTGIDALLQVRERLEAQALSGLHGPVCERLEDFQASGRKLLVVTAHRRENFGPGFERICRAVAQLAERPDVAIAWPIHPNPEVRRTVEATLRGRSNVLLLDPLAYIPFVDLMRRAYLLLTDSGGIQEEAPSLGKPVLVLREHTERPEAVQAGTVRLVGTDPEVILRETVVLLEDAAEYQRRTRSYNPYGDGQASGRIARRIASFLGVAAAPPA